MNINHDKLLDLKRRIRSKFKTLRHFGYSANIQYAELTKFFARRMRADALEQMQRNVETLLQTVESKENPKEIKDADRQYIRAKILLNYKSVERFIADNPAYTKSFVSNVINGRRVRNDARYKRLKESVESLKYSPENF